MNHRVVSQAVVVAIGVGGDGRREVLGMDVGDSEDGAFWTLFLHSLEARGLGGVQLVITDAHAGLKQAIAAVLLGSGWQRCRVHFMLRTNPIPQTSMDSSTSSPGCLAGSYPRFEAMMVHAKDDLLAFAAFPQPHWRQIWSTNPPERVTQEIKGSTDVAGCSPTPTPFCDWQERS